MARLPARRRPRDAVRLPRARAVRPGVGPPLQPGQAPARPVRQGRGRRPRRRPVPVLLPVLGRRAGHDGHDAGPGRLAGPHHGLRGGQPVLRLGPRPPAGHAVPRDGDLRGARQGPDDAPPGRPRRAARHLRGAGPPGGDRAPDQAGRHRDRAHARAPVRHRPVPGGQGPDQLLGLQHHRVLRPAQRVRGLRHARRAGHGVQGHGQGDAPGRHRGAARRGLQPHRRGQPARPHPGLPGHRQRRLLPAGRRRRGALLRHHRHGQLPAHALPRRAAAHHGLAAVLGRGDARRRVPLRPGGHPGPPVPRGRPAERVLRHRAPGPGDLPGQADRRAVGPGRRRLPGGRLPAAVDRVERPLPGHGARLLARGAGHAAGVRLPPDRVQRPVRAQRPDAQRVHQLRHRSRRLHARRPTSYNEKHNEANGEDNRDGKDDNRSWNGGAEGPTDDPAVRELRARQRRNLLVTLLLARACR